MLSKTSRWSIPGVYSVVYRFEHDNIKYVNVSKRVTLKRTRESGPKWADSGGLHSRAGPAR